MPRATRCSACQRGTGTSPTAIYARWYPTTGESTGYAIKMCLECTEHFFVPWVLAAFKSSFDSNNCSACGLEEPDHWSYTWVTAFAKKSEPLRFTLATCDSCALLFRQTFVDSGRRLEDRPQEIIGDGKDRWRQMGIEPVIA